MCICNRYEILINRYNIWWGWSPIGACRTARKLHSTCGWARICALLVGQYQICQSYYLNYFHNFERINYCTCTNWRLIIINCVIIKDLKCILCKMYQMNLIGKNILPPPFEMFCYSWGYFIKTVSIIL